MFPGKNCCDSVCATGDLPYTLTVTFSGLQDPTHSEHCQIGSTPCGARCSGFVVSRCMEPGGSEESRGPLQSVLLTNRGVGLAQPGRVSPTLTITSPKGSGATFTPVLSIDESCGCPTWSLDSVTIGGNGTGYENDSMLTIYAADGDTTVVESQAQLKATIGRAAPQLTASAPGGEGAEFSVSIEQIDDPPVWRVSAVEVLSGGSGYADETPLHFSVGPGTITEFAAYAKIVTGRTQPNVTAVFTNTEGTGAVVTPVLEEFTEYGKSYWRVSSLTIDDPGAGYAEYAYIDFYVDGVGTYNTSFFTTAIVTGVSEEGGITSLELYEPGKAYKSNGEVVSVQVFNGGRYYVPTGDGVPTSVEVLEHGTYYRIDPSLPFCASSFESPAQCGGSGAQIDPVVDIDPSSSTFGTVTEIDISQGGDGYLCWTWVDNPCNESRNDVPFVLKCTNPESLVYATASSDCGGPFRCPEGAARVVRLPITLYPPSRRMKPGVLLRASRGLGGTIEATLAKGTDEDGRDYWYISSASASGGFGYQDGEYCSFYFYDDDRPYAGATVKYDVWPSVKIHATEYTGAVGGAYSDAIYSCPRTAIGNAGQGGSLTGATVEEGGRFWIDLEYAGSPSPVDSIQVNAAVGGFARLGRIAPTLMFSAGMPWPSLDQVVGATFTPSLNHIQDETGCGFDFWSIESIGVSGGTGAHDRQVLNIGPGTGGFEFEPAAAHIIVRRSQPVLYTTVTGVNGHGSGATLALVLEQTGSEEPTWRIASVSITNPGDGFFPDRYPGGGGATVAITTATERDISVKPAAIGVSVGGDGKISSATIVSPGEYWRDTGVPDRIVVTKPGLYYRESRSSQPHVDSVTFEVVQKPPGQGSGAAISGEVDGDPYSATFGQLKNIRLTSKGDGYTFYSGGWGYVGGCNTGVPVTLQFLGKNQPVEVKIGHETFRTEPVADCNDLPETASAFHSTAGGTVTIAKGGLWDSRGADCRGEPCGDTGGSFQIPGCAFFCCCCYQDPFQIFVDGESDSNVGSFRCTHGYKEPNTGIDHDDINVPGKAVKIFRQSRASHSEEGLSWTNSVSYYCVRSSGSPLGFKWKISSQQIVSSGSSYRVTRWANYVTPDESGCIPVGGIDKGVMIAQDVYGDAAQVPEQGISLECVHQ